MKYEFRNAAGTIVAAISDDESHIVILEPGMPGFDAAAAVAAPQVAPEPPPPAPLPPVTRLQAKAALLQAGKLAQVEAVIAASDALTQLAWAEAAEFRRDSPTIAALASGVLTEAELDDLFVAAALISF